MTRSIPRDQPAHRVDNGRRHDGRSGQDRSTGGEDRSTDEIARDIEATRRDIARTLRQLEQRLSPGDLFEQAIDYFRRSGAPEFTENLGRGIRDNPLPVLLSTVGLGWLMYSSSHPSHGYSTHRSFGTGSTTGSFAERGRSTLGAAVDTGRRAMERAGEARGAMSERGSHLAERAREAREGASSGARRAGSQLQRSMQQQPLVFGVAAFAIASLAAALLPATEAEDEAMGETRDRTLRRAAEAGVSRGAEGMERVAEAAEQRAAETERSARARGEPAPPF